MAIIASDNGGGGDFSPTPQGTHLAICNMVVDLGKQPIEYQGQQSTKHQVYLRWELPHERMDWKDKDGTERNGPRVIGKTYTLSLSEKANLRKDLEAWRGRAFTAEELKGFDISKLLGVPCMVTVVHSEKGGKTYANVSGVTGVPKGMAKPDGCECGILIYDDDNLDQYDALPEWLQKKVDAQVKSQPKSPVLADGELDDDIPF